ncbi:UNVERIFIED_CONTAM: SSS family solute:Na+ symporter [Brevibacillus sp. OAP136]
MNVAIFIMIGFLILSVFLGVQAKKGKDMNLEQWAVGGRGFGTLFVFLLMAGEGYSTFTLLGASGWAYSKGAASYYVLCYTAFAYVISYWLLPPIWRYAKERRLVSQPDFFVSKYKSPALGMLVGVVGVVAMIPYLVLQFKGLGIIVSETSYGLISPSVAICLAMICLTVYVMASGIHGSAWISIIKDILVLSVVVFLGIYLPFHYYGGYQPMFESISAAKADFLTFPDKGLSVSWFISTVLLATLGLYMWPFGFGPIFSAKNAKVFRTNAAIMPLYTIMLLFAFFVGFAAILQIPDLKGPAGDLALLRLSIQTFDPWLVGFIGAAGLLTTLVPGSLMLMSAATILTKNLYQVIVPSAKEKDTGKIAKLFVPVVAIISLFFALQDSNSLSILLLTGYSIVTQLFPAMFASLLRKQFVTKQGAAVGILMGVTTVLYASLTKTTMATLLPSWPQWIHDLNIGIIALAINVISMLVVSALTRTVSVANGHTQVS